MAGKLVKQVMLKIVSSDGDSEAKLDKITAKAEELGRLHPELKVRVDSAAASAKVRVLRADLKAAADAADGDQTSLGSRLRSLGGAAGSITGIGDAMTLTSGDASMFQKVMAGASLATGLLEPVAAGAIVAAGGLAAGLTAAGAGGIVFELAAKSAITQVQAADQANKKLTGGLGQLQRELKTASSDWAGFGKAAAPGVARVMAGALGLIPKALALAQPFLAPTEGALTRIIAKVSARLGSGSLVHEIGDFARASGPDLEKVATAAGHVAMGVLGILHTFLPMSGTMLGGLDKITAKFEKWGQTLGQHSGFQSLMTTFKSETPMAVKTLGNLVAIVMHLGSAMTGLSTASNSKSLLQVLTPLSGVIADLTKNQDLDRIGLYLLAGVDAGKKLKNTFSGISQGLQGLDKGISLVGKFGGAAEGASRGAKLASGATKIWSGIQAGLNIVMAANPIILIVAAIALLAVGITLLVLKCKPFRQFWISLWGDTEKAALAAWHFLDKDVFQPIVHGVGDLVNFVRSHWKLLATIIATVLLGPIGGLVVYVVTHFHQIESAASSLVSRVTGFFRSLPGRILGALGNLGSLLWSGGVNLVMGLVHGIESVASAPVHALSGVVSDLRSLLPFSPAKKGPLSGTGSPEIAGRKIGQMLAAGLESSKAGVAASAHKVAGAAAITAAGGGQAGTAAAVLAALRGMTLKVDSGGGNQFDQFMATWIKKYVRINFGGDVQAAFGH